MKRIPVILDGDPGHDDAIAWVLANASPMLDIKAVTSCCGNQTMEKTTYNALRICTLIGLNVPVAKGRVKPFLKPPMVAPMFMVSPVLTALSFLSLPLMLCRRTL